MERLIFWSVFFECFLRLQVYRAIAAIFGQSACYGLGSVLDLTTVLFLTILKNSPFLTISYEPIYITCRSMKQAFSHFEK